MITTRMDLGASGVISNFGLQPVLEQERKIPFIDLSFLMKCLFLMRSAVKRESYQSHLTLKGYYGSFKLFHDASILE